MARAVLMRSESSGTVFVRPTTSASGIGTMSGGLFATIFPNTPRWMSSTAAPPNLVARTRSKAVGPPPREQPLDEVPQWRQQEPQPEPLPQQRAVRPERRPAQQPRVRLHE